MSKHVVYTNDACSEYDYLKDCRDNGEEALEGYTDDDLWRLAYENIDMYLQDEISNLNIDMNRPIVLVGALQRWNGRFPASKSLNTDNIGEAVRNAINSFDGENNIEIYVQNRGLYISQTGHDNPVNPSVFQFKSYIGEIDPEDDDLFAKKNVRSTSIAKAVCEVYGW